MKEDKTITINKIDYYKIFLLCIMAVFGSFISGVVISCRSRSETKVSDETEPFEKGPLVSVLLAERQNELVISSRKGGMLGSRDAQYRKDVEGGKITLFSSYDGIKIDGELWEVDNIFFFPRDDLFGYNGNLYRGTLQVQSVEGQGLKALEHLHLEDYIRGVLPVEIYPSWEMDAIVAQAIAIRTFASEMLKNPGTRGWLTTLDLAYRGADYELERTDEAVELSDGLVLSYEDKLFPAFFHSTCGGHTAGALSVFDTHDIPPLKGKECGWCDNTKHSFWTRSFKLDDIAEKIFPDRNVEIRSIETENFDEGHRPKFVVINGEERIRSSEFRIALGSTRLKSTLFIVIVSDGQAHFMGKGFGHGVGLCQWGAQGMAEAGYSWDAILSHYYPGTKVRHLDTLE